MASREVDRFRRGEYGLLNTVPGAGSRLPIGGGVQGNPFTYGNPISDPRRFVGRTREVEQIFGRLGNEEFESSSLVGDHRIGKTSLLKYLADPGVREAHGLGPGRCSFVYVDLQMVDQAMNPDRLWHRLLTLLQRQCADLGVSKAVSGLVRQDRLDAFDLDEVFQEVDENGHNVVFLLDEFERITANTNFGPDFYYGLRSLMIHHRLALVTSSRLELIELCHSDAIKSSPFFNVFANISLRMFARAEFELMVERALSGTAVAFTEPELENVLELAGLHPYFLQAACHMLYESYELRLGLLERQDFLAAGFRAQAVPHIIDYWDNSNDYEKIVLTAAAMLERAAQSSAGFTQDDLERVFSRSELWVENLAKRGLIIEAGGRYRLFSSIVGPWILVQLTAELSEEQSYHEWLAQHQAAVDRVSGKHGSLLRDVLPKIGARYRGLILTWASDPQSVAAMAGLLRSALSLVT
jgi:AAA-like domain